MSVFIKVLALTAALTLSNVVKASSFNDGECSTIMGICEDKMSHIAAGYMISTIAYGLTKNMFRLEQDEFWKARLMAGFVGLAIGFTKEAFDADPSKGKQLDGADFGAVAIGVGLSTLTTWSFKF